MHPFDAGMTAGARLAARVLNYKERGYSDSMRTTSEDIPDMIPLDEDGRATWLTGFTCGIDNVILHWNDPEIPAEPQPLLCEICNAELVVADGYYIVESLESENSLCFCTVGHLKEWCDRQ